MSSEDPNNYYPYPTKGIYYETPPSAANFPNNGEPQYYYSSPDSGYDADYDDDMDVDEDDSEPELGDGLAHPMNIAPQTDESKEADEDPGVGTFGVELEFLVVQCPRVRMIGNRLVTQDVHPNDRRWLSRKLASWQLKPMQAAQAEKYDMEVYKQNQDPGVYWDSSDEELEYKRLQYSRNKLTRVLRQRGLTVIKWPEQEINEDDDGDFVNINYFSESEASDDAREENFPNSTHLDHFYSSYDHDPSKVEFQNISSALLKWQSEFEQYHVVHNLKLYRTTVSEIDSAISRCFERGWSLSQDRLQNLRGILRDRLQNARNLAKQARENERNSQVDPLHVPVPGLKAQYKAWTVTVDFSVDGNGMTRQRYANPSSGDPFVEYCWFGAEVVSPVLALGDEQARQAIRDACGSLRDALRCHKPMQVSTGLHVHLGHTNGWTLFQAKRFASLWYLTEKTMLSLHRKDRDVDRKLTWLIVYCQWCAKIGEGSRLWRALYSDVNQRNDCAGAIMNNYSPAVKRAYTAEFAKNIPHRNQSLTETQYGILHYIWHYHSIDDLHYALGENKYCRTGIKWRIRGKHSSLHAYEDPDVEYEEGQQPGTIEVRIMHGTLDADHINNWVTVLERVAHVVRNLSDEEFSEILNQFISNQTRERLLELLGVPDDIRQYWLDRKRRDAGDRYWEYPDRDLVDWRQPFMVPGHKATHGSFWD
ncbi:hypothetical protein F4679DRAFT_571185 [Xylaria curta]|nr:hypothetical protein F4679DRAFT_571185 [Xylaria curta]